MTHGSVLLTLLVAGSAALPSAVQGLDDGRFDNVDPATRAWWKSVRSPHGVPCCDISDGHLTDWRGDADGTYWVPIADNWYQVPPEAIVYDAGNPYEKAVVWYVNQGVDENGKPAIYIRCFVPTGGM
jgi:hypothetical protein